RRWLRTLCGLRGVGPGDALRDEVGEEAAPCRPGSGDRGRGMVRRPRRHPRLEGSGVDLGETQPGDVVQALSASEPVGDTPEVPTVGTEGMAGSPARSKLIQEGVDQLAHART